MVAKLPEYITVGPVAHREFTPDGRLIVNPVGGVRGEWTVQPGEREIGHAASLALALDVFYKTTDLTEGGSYTFTLTTMLDPWQPSQRHIAYGVYVPIPLDWEWFAAHAHINPGVSALQRLPADSLWPRSVGVGEHWDANGGSAPSLFNRIWSIADPADPKWAGIWSPQMPAPSRRERSFFEGFLGPSRQLRRWVKKNGSPRQVR